MGFAIAVGNIAQGLNGGGSDTDRGGAFGKRLFYAEVAFSGNRQVNAETRSECRKCVGTWLGAKRWYRLVRSPFGVSSAWVA